MQPIFITADADEAAEIKKLSRSDRQQLAKHIRHEAIAMRRAVKLIALLPIAHLGGKLRNVEREKVYSYVPSSNEEDGWRWKYVSPRIRRLFADTAGPAPKAAE